MSTTTERPSTPKRLAKAAVPPVWPIEAFIARVGKIPAAIGRFLDRLARFPPPIGWLIRMFSKVWVGILFLILTGGYIAIGSGFASLRAKLEMTDLQFFDAWPMITLLLLLATSLIVVTLRKIPFTLYKLGVWTVHTGILIMLSGCFIYFSQKVEGLTRIYLGKSVDCFYDSTERAIYITRMDPDDFTKPAGPEIMVRLPTLPFFQDHLASMPPNFTPGTPLDIAIPADALAADLKLSRAAFTITGYYPFADTDVEALPGPATMPAVDPAVCITAGNSMRWLRAASPAHRVLDMKSLGLEFLFHPAPERIAALTTPFKGAMAITVRVPAMNVTRTYVIEMDKEITVEGTPYTLIPRGLVEPMAMASKGYEGAASGGITIDIKRKDGDTTTEFQRMVLLRYPERSPDFITVEGKPKRIQDRVDNNLDIEFIDASKDQYTLIQKDDDSLVMIHRQPGGDVSSAPAKIGDPIGPVLTLAEYTPHALPRDLATWVPNEARPMNLTASDVLEHSMAEVRITANAWSLDKIAVPFIEYANAQGSRRGRSPSVIVVPGVGPVSMVLSTTRRPLPSTLTLAQFEVQKYPGAANFIQDYRSFVHITDDQTHAQKDVLAHLNSPAEDHGLYLFQARWDGNPDAAPADRYTELGVANRPGIRVMISGAILIIAGVLYSFYVKPILLNMRKAQLAAYVAKLVS